MAATTPHPAPRTDRLCTRLQIMGMVPGTTLIKSVPPDFGHEFPPASDSAVFGGGVKPCARSRWAGLNVEIPAPRILSLSFQFSSQEQPVEVLPAA